MSTLLKKDLGIASAYGAAIQGGYQGTIEEFYEALGNIGSITDQIDDAVAPVQTQFLQEIEALRAEFQQSIRDGVKEAEEYALNGYQTPSKSGGIVAIADGASLPIKALTLETTPYQAGTGNPTPDNVRAIYGLRSFIVFHGGKNCMALPSVRSKTMSGLTYTQDENGVTISGTASGASYYQCGASMTLGAGTYILTGCPQGGSANTWFLELIKSGESPARLNDYGNGITFEVTEGDAVNNQYAVQLNVENGVTPPAYWTPMIRSADVLDATPDTWWRNSYSIELPLLYFGGTIDVLNGKVMSTWVRNDVDSEDWTIVQIPEVTDKIIFQKTVDWETPVEMPLCNRLTPVASITTSNAQENTISVSATQIRICLPVEDANTVTRQYIEEWIASNPVQVAYKLATGTEYDVEPIEISTVYGYNYFMLARYEIGKINLTYRADPTSNYIARVG